MPTTQAQDAQVFYSSEGSGTPALLFIHGWLGTSQWWAAQSEFFSARFTVLRMDLPGHGQSSGFSGEWSSSLYATAIKAVIEDSGASEVVLVAHSMAGAYALEASLLAPQVKGVVLVDTLKNLDQLMSYEQADQMLFSLYRSNFKSAVELVLPKHLFAASTPPEVKERLQREFLSAQPERAIELIAPLYKMDPRSIALKVKVPVRAINSDFTPTNEVNNAKYLADYGFTEMTGTGHYPMLEQPEAFNRVLNTVLSSLLSSLVG